MDAIKHFRDLHVYQGGKALVMEIFEVSKTFPVEERYALTDQVRRSCRSICANLAEAWRKRRYPAAFVAKLNDAETGRVKRRSTSRLHSGIVTLTKRLLRLSTTHATKLSHRLLK